MASSLSPFYLINKEFITVLYYSVMNVMKTEYTQSGNGHFLVLSSMMVNSAQPGGWGGDARPPLPS